jgi:uncharacterized membrane protein
MSWEALILRPRLVISFVLAVILGLLLPASLPIWSKCLIAWCFGVTVYMALVTTELSRATLDKIRESASRLDDSAPVILVVSMAATAASFGGIAALLLAPSSPNKTMDIVLAASTMVLSWLFLQVIFAIHYTHIFFGDVGGIPRGGLEFGGKDDQPDFWDFLYFTTSIGATAQTSDTIVTSKTMRRIVLAQSIYTFFFNTAVLALAINIAASLAGH